MVACLVEKQRTTPDQYPLTLNALRLACNQSTNRDPVVDYDESTIRSALDRLSRRKWATLASWSTSRSVKYKHLLDAALGLGDAQLALVCVLMLRGPQTAGELRQRSERIHGFESGEEVEGALDELVERELAVALPRRPGERGQRYAHRLAEVEEDAGAAPAEAAASTRAFARRAAPGPVTRGRRLSRAPRAPRGRGGRAARPAARAARRAGRLAGPRRFGHHSGGSLTIGGQSLDTWTHVALGGPARGAAGTCRPSSRAQHALRGACRQRHLRQPRPPAGRARGAARQRHPGACALCDPGRLRPRRAGAASELRPPRALDPLLRGHARHPPGLGEPAALGSLRGALGRAAVRLARPLRRLLLPDPPRACSSSS